MKNRHKLSKNSSICGKNCKISGPYNFWTSVKSNIPDVWNWNFWTLLCSTITFKVNSHADNHSCRYIYLFQILYSMKSDFFIKIHIKVLMKVFYIQIWFKCETPLLLFLIRTPWSIRKKKNKQISFYSNGIPTSKR